MSEIVNKNELFQTRLILIDSRASQSACYIQALTDFLKAYNFVNPRKIAIQHLTVKLAQTRAIHL